VFGVIIIIGVALVAVAFILAITLIAAPVHPRYFARSCNSLLAAGRPSSDDPLCRLAYDQRLNVPGRVRSRDRARGRRLAGMAFDRRSTGCY
jgi:hypothetical protein